MATAEDNKSPAFIEITFFDVWDSAQGPPPKVHRLPPSNAGQ